MEREIIERLTMDSASGELNEDAKVLLQTYLAEHSQENLWAEDMFKLYETANAAVKIKTNQSNAEPSKAIHKNSFLRMNIISIGRCYHCICNYRSGIRPMVQSTRANNHAPFRSHLFGVPTDQLE